MDDELKIKLSKILNPHSILPNFSLARLHDPPQENISLVDNQLDASEEYRTEPPLKKKRGRPAKCTETLKKNISQDDMYESNTSVETANVHTSPPEECLTESLPEKRKRCRPKKCFDCSKNNSKYQGRISHKPPQQNILQDDISQSNSSEETDDSHTSEEYTIDLPPKKKKLSGPEKCFDSSKKSRKIKLKLFHKPPQQNILRDDINQSDASEKKVDNHMPEEHTTEPPPEKKKQSKSTKCLIFSEKSRKHQGMLSRDLNQRIQGDKVIGFCQEIGLVASGVVCSCGKQMRLVSKSGHDGCRWMCYGKEHNGRPNQTIRKGTWFESSKLSIGDILWLAYMWVHEYSIISMMHECDHSNSTVMGWTTSCLDFCREIVEFKSKPIGGEEASVEIFCCTINKNKQPTGRWAFCAIELCGTNFLHLIIDDKDSFNLRQIFDKYILPRTKVVANNWSLFKTLKSEDFSYLIMKRSISFLDLVTNKKINSFEMFKKLLNRPSKLDEWSKLEFGPSYFEKIYRKCLKCAPDPFLAFLKDVAMVYKPCDAYFTNSTETKK